MGPLNARGISISDSCTRVLRLSDVLEPLDLQSPDLRSPSQIGKTVALHGGQPRAPAARGAIEDSLQDIRFMGRMSSQRKCRPMGEPRESRALLATFLVNTLADSAPGPKVSLRE